MNMTENLFKTTVLCTKISKITKERYPELIGVEFSFETCEAIIIFEDQITIFNNHNYYKVDLFMLKHRVNKDEIPDQLVRALERLYDFLKL